MIRENAGETALDGDSSPEQRGDGPAGGDGSAPPPGTISSGRAAGAAAQRAAAQAARSAHEAAAAEHVAEQAEEAAGEHEAGAAQHEKGAAQHEQSAAEHEAGAAEHERAAREAAARVADDDPLLDTAIRKVAVAATPEHPFGLPGRPLSTRSPFRIAFSASLGVALAYLLGQAVINSRFVLTLLLVAAFLAMGLNPTVERLARRLGSRGRAVALVFTGVIVFFVGFGLAAVPPAVNQITEFTTDAPGLIQDLTKNPTINELNQRFQIIDRASAYVQNAVNDGAVFGGVVGVGRVVFSGVFSALTVLILTLYFLGSFPAIKRTAYLLVPRSRRPRVTLLTDQMLNRVGGYVAGAVTIGAIAGVTSFIFLLAVGAPYPLALALLVAVLDVVPLIGATIGAVVVSTICFFVDIRTGLFSVAFYVLYQQVENYVIYPRVMERSVDVSPAATIVAVLIGGALLGVIGALLAIPIAAAVQLVMNEVVLPRQDRS